MTTSREGESLLLEIFIEESLSRLAQMRAHLAELETRREDGKALSELMRRFHSIAGIGGIEGVELMNLLASRGESECRALMGSGGIPSDTQVRCWQATVEILAAEVDDIRRIRPASPPAASGPSSRNLQVLLVEDDRELHEQFKAALASQGMSLRSAFTLEEAISEIDRQTPDALIVDVGLPEGSGHRVMDHFRRLPSGERTPAIVISRLGEFCDKTEAIRSGADGFFCKPLDPELVIRRLTLLLSQRGEAKSRILSVEDDPDHAAYVKLILESAGHEVHTCGDPAGFEGALNGLNPDLILMDILLPGSSGYQLARFVRQSEDHATTPILFLTSESHLQSRIETTRAGGDDHLVKPISPQLLLAAVEIRLERSRALLAMLERDSLTGLLNRAGLQKRLRAAARRVAQGSCGAVIMVDVDHFKSVNDLYGHAIGDRVLTNLATFLRQQLRPADAISRHGGEEFLIVVQEADETEALQLARRLVRDFAATTQSVPGGESLHVTFSAGVAAIPADVRSLPDCLQAADIALYQAKAAGRNTAKGRASRTLPFVAAVPSPRPSSFGAETPRLIAVSSIAS
jgi:diguanylate cyclase (GGDEF)-like protein